MFSILHISWNFSENAAVTTVSQATYKAASLISATVAMPNSWIL